MLALTDGISALCIKNATAFGGPPGRYSSFDVRQFLMSYSLVFYRFIVSATDLFAFQGSQARSTPKPSALPSHIRNWPALPSDPLAASVELSSDERPAPGEDLDVRDLANLNSILVVIDAAGYVHLFLDGTYPLGAYYIHPSYQASFVYKTTAREQLFVNARISTAKAEQHNLIPLVIDFPLLDNKMTRRVAENSTTARELIWYTMRVIKDMRQLWFGVDGQDSARVMNSYWAKGLEERQTKFNRTSTSC